MSKRWLLVDVTQRFCIYWHNSHPSPRGKNVHPAQSPYWYSVLIQCSSKRTLDFLCKQVVASTRQSLECMLSLTGQQWRRKQVCFYIVDYNTFNYYCKCQHQHFTRSNPVLNVCNHVNNQNWSHCISLDWGLIVWGFDENWNSWSNVCCDFESLVK